MLDDFAVCDAQHIEPCDNIIVDFSNSCPILQQLMSNWSIARGFRPIFATLSTARDGTLAARMPAVPPTNDGLQRFESACHLNVRLECMEGV
jgi:hypothetical protein